MIYYKTTPLTLFQKPFMQRRPSLKKDGPDLSKVLPSEFVAEEIARD
jgi:hypothetical protein